MPSTTRTVVARSFAGGGLLGRLVLAADFTDTFEAATIADCLEGRKCDLIGNVARALSVAGDKIQEIRIASIEDISPCVSGMLHSRR